MFISHWPTYLHLEWQNHTSEEQRTEVENHHHSWWFININIKSSVVPFTFWSCCHLLHPLIFFFLFSKDFQTCPFPEARAGAQCSLIHIDGSPHTEVRGPEMIRRQRCWGVTFKARLLGGNGAPLKRVPSPIIQSRWDFSVCVSALIWGTQPLADLSSKTY